jgi:hypothetical protein
MNEFLLLAFIISYTGIITLTWMLTQATKMLIDRWKPENRTRYVVLFWVVLLVSIRAVVQAADIEILTFMSLLAIIVEWFINTFIIWLGIMQANGYVVDKIKGTKTT